MPKTYDINHNYYADLDLPLFSNCEDVKRQYRKLALQYHPDRNAGKEQKCKPKFQAIQAAHEILSDSVSKRNYDVLRRQLLGPDSHSHSHSPQASQPQQDPSESLANLSELLHRNSESLARMEESLRDTSGLLQQNSELLARVDDELRRIYERSPRGRLDRIDRMMRDARMRAAEKEVRDYGYRTDQRGFWRKFWDLWSE